MNNFTPRAQQVLAHARREADRFNHHYIGTEHLLLGLLKLGKGVAVTILENLGVELTAVTATAWPDRFCATSAWIWNKRGANCWTC